MFVDQSRFRANPWLRQVSPVQLDASPRRTSDSQSQQQPRATRSTAAVAGRRTRRSIGGVVAQHDLLSLEFARHTQRTSPSVVEQIRQGRRTLRSTSGTHRSAIDDSSSTTGSPRSCSQQTRARALAKRSPIAARDQRVEQTLAVQYASTVAAHPSSVPRSITANLTESLVAIEHSNLAIVRGQRSTKTFAVPIVVQPRPADDTRPFGEHRPTEISHHHENRHYAKQISPTLPTDAVVITTCSGILIELLILFETRTSQFLIAFKYVLQGAAAFICQHAR